MLNKSLIIALTMVTALLFSSCGGGPSDKDLKGSIDGIKGVYTGLFKVLEENKANPNKALAEGEKYVEANKDKLKGYGKVFGGGVKASQVEMINTFKTDIQTMSREAGKKLGPSFARVPGAAGKLGNLMTKIGTHMTSGQTAGNGAASGKAMNKAREMAKKNILKTANMVKATPPSARKQVLDSWISAIAKMGADKAEQDAFRKELKEKLGWK